MYLDTAVESLPCLDLHLKEHALRILSSIEEEEESQRCASRKGSSRSRDNNLVSEV
jgi:hypothetical protein